MSDIEEMLQRIGAERIDPSEAHPSITSIGGQFPLSEGDTMVVAQLSPCVGGLLRTWTDETGPQLWSSPDADWLLAQQGTGTMARTLREENRYREVAMLAPDKGTLLIQPRFPNKSEGDTLHMDARVVQLESPVEPSETVIDEFHALLATSIQHCVANGEFLVVEHGGWDAPDTPYCVFALMPGENGEVISTIEATPPPHGSEVWDPHIVAGQDGAGLNAPANPDTLEVAPALMIEAIRTWGISPWDIGLTFGRP